MPHVDTCLIQTSLNLSELEPAHNRTCFERGQSTKQQGLTCKEIYTFPSYPYPKNINNVYWLP